MAPKTSSCLLQRNIQNRFDRKRVQTRIKLIYTFLNPPDKDCPQWHYRCIVWDQVAGLPAEGWRTYDQRKAIEEHVKFCKAAEDAHNNEGIS